MTQSQLLLHIMSSASASAEEDTHCKIVTGDGEKFRLPTRAASMSSLISSMIDESEPEGLEIPLPNIDGAIFETILKWLMYHMEKPPAEVVKVAQCYVCTSVITILPSAHQI